MFRIPAPLCRTEFRMIPERNDARRHLRASVSPKPLLRYTRDSGGWRAAASPVMNAAMDSGVVSTRERLRRQLLHHLGYFFL